MRCSVTQGEQLQPQQRVARQVAQRHDQVAHHPLALLQSLVEQTCDAIRQVKYHRLQLGASRTSGELGRHELAAQLVQLGVEGAAVLR